MTWYKQWRYLAENQSQLANAKVFPINTITRIISQHQHKPRFTGMAQ